MARYSHWLTCFSDYHREFQIPMTYKEKKTKECFTFLRFAHARDRELLLFSTSPVSSDDDYKTNNKHDDQKVSVIISNNPRILDSFFCPAKWTRFINHQSLPSSSMLSPHDRSSYSVLGVAHFSQHLSAHTGLNTRRDVTTTHIATHKDAVAHKPHSLSHNADG